MTTLIIARHGNTFGPEDTPTRVGAHTDLPLVKSGQEQARKIGAWLKEQNILVYLGILTFLKVDNDMSYGSFFVNFADQLKSI